MPAVTTIPPMPASTGSAMSSRSCSSPRSNSRRASSPITKKKNVIRPLLIQWPSVWEIPASPTRIDSVVSQTPRYDDASTFAQIRAAAVAPSRIVALPVSVRRKELSGVSRLRAHAVRPENRVTSAAAMRWRPRRSYGVSATAASGVATRKLKLSSRYRRTASTSCSR